MTLGGQHETKAVFTHGNPSLFGRGYYVVTRDERVYFVVMSWPSMQLLSIDAENAK